MKSSPENNPPRPSSNNGRDAHPRVLKAVPTILVVSIFVSAGARAADPPKIMLLGDSITQGNATHDSYRRPLWHLIDDAGIPVDFVGSMDQNFDHVPNPNPDFDLDHEGHWGWRADAILTQITTWATAAQPDVVLMHLGSNDAFQAQDETTTVDELKQIVEALRAVNPDVIVLVAQILPSANATEDAAVDALNALIPPMVEANSTEQSPIHVVDQNTDFDPATETYDGQHPNAAGEQEMAERWFAVLEPILNPGAVLPAQTFGSLVTPGVLLLLAGRLMASGKVAARNTRTTRARWRRR